MKNHKIYFEKFAKYKKDFEKVYITLDKSFSERNSEKNWINFYHDGAVGYSFDYTNHTERT